MRLTSPAFDDNSPIPERFSYEEGDCINPELNIEGVPEGTASLALMMDDIDAPEGSFVHWAVFDIPPDRTKIEEDSIPGVQGRNSAKRKNYTGPRTPAGSTHRYKFTVYALDKKLGLPEGTYKSTISDEMAGHVLDEASLTGTYSRKVPAGV